jgi:hypothetical protein
MLCAFEDENSRCAWKMLTPKAAARDRLELADCRHPPLAANWKSDRRTDADDGDFEVPSPAAGVGPSCSEAGARECQRPARSIGDRAGSLSAELSIDWNTRLEEDGNDY